MNGPTTPMIDDDEDQAASDDSEPSNDLATVLLFSPNTGALIAVMDGRVITEMRTAAVSAVSARVLARDEAQTVAIIGSGAQARSHLEAMERVFELTEVRVWSPTPDHQMAFTTQMERTTETRLVGCNSAEQAVHHADVIVLATSASAPVIQNEWVASGAHVISIGACRPGSALRRLACGRAGGIGRRGHGDPAGALRRFTPGG